MTANRAILVRLTVITDTARGVGSKKVPFSFALLTAGRQRCKRDHHTEPSRCPYTAYTLATMASEEAKGADETTVYYWGIR